MGQSNDLQYLSEASGLFDRVHKSMARTHDLCVLIEKDLGAARVALASLKKDKGKDLGIYGIVTSFKRNKLTISQVIKVITDDLATLEETFPDLVAANERLDYLNEFNGRLKDLLSEGFNPKLAMEYPNAPKETQRTIKEYEKFLDTTQNRLAVFSEYVKPFVKKDQVNSGYRSLKDALGRLKELELKYKDVHIDLDHIRDLLDRTSPNGDDIAVEEVESYVAKNQGKGNIELQVNGHPIREDIAALKKELKTKWENWRLLQER